MSNATFKPNSHLLRKASRLWGLQTSYIDQVGAVIAAPVQSLLEVLQGLTGQSIRSDEDLLQLIQRRHSEHEARGLEPVHATWEGQSLRLNLILQNAEVGQKCLFEITDEQGQSQSFEWTPSKKRDRWQAPANLAVGYHQLRFRTPLRELNSLIIKAPRQIPDIAEYSKSWGAFLPLYALRSPGNWGMGSYSDLKKAADILNPQGCKWLSCLPLLAGNFDPPDCDPSPYSALTRLFWNEIYLDVESLVEASSSSAAKLLMSSDSFQAELKKLRELEYVDYHAVYQLKAEILRILSRDFFATGGAQGEDYRKFKSLYPDLDAYAEFRSRDPEHQNFHRYVQFQTHLALSRLAKDSPCGLYMDYPVGVNESGFDFHHYRDIFFQGVEVGAPPEVVFQLGQGWGFPSYHPDRLRASQYAYVRQSLVNHFRYSRILRLDHVMGLHRVFVIPNGRKPKDGVYLRYKPQEFFAISCLEAFRANADLIGENLGTVPAAVDEILVERNFKTMTVGQFMFEMGPEKMAEAIPQKTLACINNHDMPMFASFLSGQDLDHITQLGILNPEYTTPFKKARNEAKKVWQRWVADQGKEQSSEHALFLGMLKNMAESHARYFVLNPEDSWGETRPQNIPGTYREVPNWRRKFSVALQDWPQHQGLQSATSLLAKARP